MAVGDVFKKRRNLVQSAAPAMRNALNYRPGHPDYVPPKPPTYQERYRMANGQNPGNANFIFGVDDRDDNGNPMRPQDAIVNVQDGEDPDPNGYSLIPPSMTGTYKQNQPVYFQGVDPRTGQVSRVPISHKQMSAFNNPFLGSGDMGRPEDGSIAPVAGGPRSFNPQNQGPVQPLFATLTTPSNAAIDGYVKYAESYGQIPRLIFGRSPRLGESGYAVLDGGIQNAGRPQSFNPSNQDVLARAAAALDAVKQDRLNPMGGQGSPGLRGFVDSVGSGFRSLVSGLREVGQSAMGGPVGGRYMIAPPAMNTELAPAYDPQAAAMDSLRAKIDARVTQSQQDNPMVPRQPYDPMQEGIVQGRRQDQFMSNARIAGSSGEAGVTARSIPGDLYNPITARPANRYDGMVQSDRDQTRMTPNEKLELAERSAGRYMQGGAAADPTNMRGRFGGEYGNTLNADAAAIAGGRAVRTADGKVVYHTGTQESARAAYMSARANGYGRTPEQEAARHAKAVEQAKARAAKHQAFKDANGGMSYRQYDRMTGSSNGNNALTMKAVREGRLSPEEANYRMQLRAEKALRRSGNPITGGTSQAGRLFPDQMAGRGGQQAPAAPLGNPIFGPGAPNTVENVNARVTARQANVQSSPTLSAWGVSPDLDPSGFAQAVGQNLFPRQPDGKFGFAEVSDDGIKSIFNQVKLFDPTGDGKPPFPEGSIYNQMWGLPEDTPPAELRKMFEAMLANMNSVPQAPMGQAGRTYGKL